jgi:aminopeptidase 2
MYTFPDALNAGIKTQLCIAFAGKFTDTMIGYDKSSSPGGIYALTQSKPTDTRRAIPCWNEPLLKATFSFTMISRLDTVSLCNINVLDKPPAEEQITEKLFAGMREGK